MSRTGRNNVEITLFPFLSVLVCTIGALSLIIIGTTLGMTEIPAEVMIDVSGASLQLAALDTRKELVQAQVDAGRNTLEHLLERLRQVATIRRTVSDYTTRIDQYKLANASTERQLKSLQAEIARRKKAIEESRPKPSPGTAIVIPDAIKGRNQLKPIFVDCRKEGLLILQNRKAIPFEQIEGSAYLEQLLRKVKTARNWCVILLVRSDGVKSFNKVFHQVQEEDVPYNMHPVSGAKDFDVRDWEKPDWLR